MTATRAFSHRSRAGCRTCKIRHTKCDEQRPSCHQCVKTGRKCDGYTRPPSNRHSHSQSESSLLAICSFSSRGTKQEKRALHFFRTRTVPELCAYFSDVFWERDVLQSAEAHEASRHAAVALGACHEHFLTTVSPGKRKQSQSHGSASADLFVLRQYSKAISQLRSSLSRTETDRKTREPTVLVLTASAILASVDSLMGNVDSAVTHLHSCSAILRSESLKQRQSGGGGTARIQRTLARLAHQVVFYVDGKTIGASPDGRKLSLWSSSHCDSAEASSGFRLPSDETEISNLGEARDELDGVLDGILHFFYEPIHSNSSGCREIENADHLQCLQRWLEAFEKFLQSHELSGRALRGAVMLKIHALVAGCMLSNPDAGSNTEDYSPSASSDESNLDLYSNLTPESDARSNDDATFDFVSTDCTSSTYSTSSILDFDLHLTPVSDDIYSSDLKRDSINVQLSQIATLSASLIAAHDNDKDTNPPIHQTQNPYELPSQQLLISTELGIIGPLYYAGLWTSDVALQERIIGLLDGRWRREGVWDSFVAGRALRGIWAAKGALKKFGPKDVAERVLSGKREDLGIRERRGVEVVS